MVEPYEEEACKITRGEPFNITMTGTSQKAFSDLIIGADIHIGSWQPIMADAVCHMGMRCPVQRGQHWRMHYTSKFDDGLPSGEFETKWELVGNILLDIL